MKVEEEIQQMLERYYVPALFIDENREIKAINRLALSMFGPLDRTWKCFTYLKSLHKNCGDVCVKHQISNQPQKTRIGSVILKPKNKHDNFEFELSAIKVVDDHGKHIGHIEVFEELSIIREIIRTSRNFSDKIGLSTERKDVFENLISFLSNNHRGLKFRIRIYDYITYFDPNPSILKLVMKDFVQTTSEYIEGLGSREIDSHDNPVSFLCFEKESWVLITPNKDYKNMFVANFKAEQDEKNPKIYYSKDAYFSQLLLYLYDENDKFKRVFKKPENHTWLDIPLIIKNRKEGKIAISFSHDKYSFYRERFECLSIIMNIAVNRLKSIALMKENERKLNDNVVHEVAQPAFSALASIEFLRRRDIQNRKTPEKELFEYYLKKNIENSIKMIAFLNDRPRISEQSLNYNDSNINLLSDVLSGTVNLIRFKIYETYLRESDENLKPEYIKDVDLAFKKNQNTIQTVEYKDFDVNYKIVYSQDCDEIFLFLQKYRLQQVFFNLLENALKYKNIDTDYKVKICYHKPLYPDRSLYKDYFIIDVIDSGIGIADHDIPYIFDLFYRCENIKKSSIVGGGRGLYVCREVMRGIGGDIILYNSRNPTIFRLLIPKECSKHNWYDKLNDLSNRTQALLNEIQ